MAIGRKISGKSRRPLVTLSASSFIPKRDTPFQWVGMYRIENLDRKQDRISARVRRGVRFKHHHCETSFLEGVFSRGDRALSDVIERAWRNGARFDSWAEHFDRKAWDDAFRSEGVDPERYAYRDLDPARPLPWHVVHSRVNRKWLAIELRRAMEAGTLSVCGPTDCHGCAPFAKECVKGVVAETTDRILASDVPLLSTPFAPGPGAPIGPESAPGLPVESSVADQTTQVGQSERPVYRYRARFTKSGSLRFIGHLDLTRLILRGLRRAGLELVYSRGFNPKPKVGFGPALALGIASEAEYVDFDTYRRLDDDGAEADINGALPDALQFDLVKEIPRGAAALGEAIRAARYRVATRGAGNLAEVVAAFRARLPIEIRRQKKNGGSRSFDLTKELLALEATDVESLSMTLAMHHDGASVRPDEVLKEVFGESTPALDLVREELLVDWKGRLVNPILAASASSPGS